MTLYNKRENGGGVDGPNKHRTFNQKTCVRYHCWPTTLVTIVTFFIDVCDVFCSCNVVVFMRLPARLRRTYTPFMGTCDTFGRILRSEQLGDTWRIHLCNTDCTFFKKSHSSRRNPRWFEPSSTWTGRPRLSGTQNQLKCFLKLYDFRTGSVALSVHLLTIIWVPVEKDWFYPAWIDVIWGFPPRHRDVWPPPWSRVVGVEWRLVQFEPSEVLR